jgi:hypothetical protein
LGSYPAAAGHKFESCPRYKNPSSDGFFIVLLDCNLILPLIIQCLVDHVVQVD